MPDFEPVSSGALPSSEKEYKDKTRRPRGTRASYSLSNLPLKFPDHKPNTDTSKAESVAGWFSGFFQAILGLSTLGASVTFSFVLSSSSAFASVQLTRFTPKEVSRFLAVSWLLFILALALSSAFSTVLQFYHDDAIAWWSRGGRDKRIILWYASLVSSLLYGLTISAFIFLCLVVTAFQPAIGWTALGFTAFFGLGGLLSIALRTPLGLSWLGRFLREFGRKPKGIIDSPGSVHKDSEEQNRRDSRQLGIEQENVV